MSMIFFATSELLYHSNSVWDIVWEILVSLEINHLSSFCLYDLYDLNHITHNWKKPDSLSSERMNIFPEILIFCIISGNFVIIEVFVFFFFLALTFICRSSTEVG